ncbi:glycosyltransferase family 4 protein [Klebsiella pneumoniae]|uniref:glycosyltransferase family 4 protein n=2 Tax=Klebsiella pneumoniae complex TaxID=3390273 RepID=UPI00388E5868
MIVIHEYGEPSHYAGAIEANKYNNSHVEYHEFSCIKIMIKSLIRKDSNAFKKAIKDLFFFISCYIFPALLRNKYIIIGIAPVDFRILFFNRILKYSKVTYHTSWMIWDGHKFPKNNYFLKNTIKKQWHYFLYKIVDSFAVVTDSVKEQLVINMGVDPSKIDVVYHSYDESIFSFHNNSTQKDKPVNIVFAGRLVKSKGVEEFLKIAESNPKINFYIIGRGDEELRIKDACSFLPNLSFVGYVGNRTLLASYYKEADFILLPSKRTEGWEELFGMVIIEAMACGCIPICTDHNGPITILKNSSWMKNIIKEDEYVVKTNNLINMYLSEPSLMLSDRQLAIDTALLYSRKNISQKWCSVFKKAGV